MKPNEPSKRAAFEVEVHIDIDAPREKVWQALVTQTAKWWHKDFYVTERPATVVCEPRLGGRLFEDCGDGTGFTWFEIQGIEPPNYLYLIGHTRPPYGGPCTSLIMITLNEANGGNTSLTISDTTHGLVSDQMADALREGWRMLFGELKRFVEAV